MLDTPLKGQGAWFCSSFLWQYASHVREVVLWATVLMAKKWKKEGKGILRCIKQFEKDLKIRYAHSDCLIAN